MRRLIEFQIERAESYFRAAEPLVRELSFDARFPTLLMGGVYATVLAKTAARSAASCCGSGCRSAVFRRSSSSARRLVRPRFV